LGGLLILYTIYSSRVNLKTHFNIIYLTFALHLISIASISNMVDDYSHDGIWMLFALVLAASSYYFYKVSHEIKAMSLYVFMIVYAYIGLNIFLVRFFEFIDFSDVWMLFVFILPAYFIGSIVLFIKLIKNFHKEITE
jgi:hypothetical protein